MKITIVGPGAIGSLIGTLLLKSKEEVSFLDYNPKRAQKIRRDGIRIEGLTDLHQRGVRITTNPKEIGPSDLVIITTKSYNTEDAARSARLLMGEKTQILTIQNGIGNIQILEDTAGAGRVIGGITNQGANIIHWGRVIHAGRGETVIGRADRKTLGPIRDVARALTRAGLTTKISKDINSIIWSKLIINAGINALTAVTRLNNGLLLEFDGTRAIMKKAVTEAVKVAKRKKIRLLYDDPIQKLELVCKATADNVSSMLADILNKKKTEIDFINGAIVRHGASCNIPTPANEFLTNVIKAIEASYKKQVAVKK